MTLGLFKEIDHIICRKKSQYLIENEIKDIISELERTQPEGFTDITNALLDLDHETRREVINLIQTIRDKTIIDGKMHDFSCLTRNKIGITCFSQKSTGNLESFLSSFCSLKKYQSQADRWIGLGIKVIDSEHFIHVYNYDGEKWKRNINMDYRIKLAIKNGLIKEK